MMGSHANTIWTDEQAEALMGHLVLGMSMAEIAAAINERFSTSYSRNAACGKAFRLGLKAPGKPKVQPKYKRKYAPRDHLPAPRQWQAKLKPIFKTEIVRMECVEIVLGNVSLVDLVANGCRYPVNDISPFLFCNHRQLEKSSYCSGHYQLSIRPGFISEQQFRKMEAAHSPAIR